MFVKKETYIFNVQCGNSCRAELHSKKCLFMAAPSIEIKLSVKKGNQYSRDEDQQSDDTV